MPTASGARSVRSVAFAVSAVSLSLGAHATAGGDVPDVPLLLLLIALVDAVSSTFARRPRGPTATAVALLAAQVVLHGAFMFAAPAHAAHAAHAGHLHSLPMLVAHGIAAFVLAVLLSHGERLITHVARVLLPVALLRPFRPLLATRLVVAVPSDVPPLRLAATLHDISRRGPPESSLAARA
jgi:hypothetical protein